MGETLEVKTKVSYWFTSVVLARQKHKPIDSLHIISACVSRASVEISERLVFRYGKARLP